MRIQILVATTMLVGFLSIPGGAAQTCEPGMPAGEVCASASGTVSDLPDTTAHCGPGSGDCVGFSSSGSASANFEHVRGALYDMHYTGVSCAGAAIFLTTSFCVVNVPATGWHDDYNDVCNEIKMEATGVISGGQATDIYEAGPGC